MTTENMNAEIVSLTNFRKAQVYNPIAEVEAYWEGLRGVRVLPLRSEINPRGIEKALDHTFLLEKVAPGLARFRLAGRQLNDLVGMEVRGMPITSIMSPDARDEMRDALTHLFEGPEIVNVRLTAKGGFGRPTLSARLIILPLKSDLGDVSRAIGCIAIEGNIGRTPRRFDIAELSFSQIGPFKTAQPEAPQLDQTDHHSKGFAESRRAFRGKSPVKRTAKKSTNFLRLIESGTETLD